ncbi:4Fe-4S dicluster domain-containing protein, partial [Patescibacteria group bacterium]|nr:4Fe-4S dicluster domain-containing protein [Patescibacteria group bacterium]
IAGGHSFRPNLKERYYNWFYHKFVRAYREYGKSQCVGCGACKHNCPAKIDIQEVLSVILRDYRSNQ